MTMAKRVANIRIKRVYDPPDKDDGTRMLVDRLWPPTQRGGSVDVVAEGDRAEPGNCACGSVMIRRDEPSLATGTTLN